MKKVIIAAAITLIAVPAFAETTLYGTARMATFYNIADAKTTANTGKTAGFDEHLQGNSTLGANLKNSDITGRVEFGAGTGNVALRLLYGTWNFGSGKLTVGQDYNGYYQGAAQVHGDDLAFKGYGALWDNRLAQIRVNLNNGLYFAAITPNGNVNGTPTASGAIVPNAEANSNIKLYLPKLNIGYAGKAGNFSYNAGVVGQTFKNVTVDEQVNALLGYVNGKASFGATTLMANLSYAQNAGNMGFAGRQSYSTASRKNAQGFEGCVQLTQKLSDSLSANAGIGYVTDKTDTGVAATKNADNKMSFFVNAPITLAKNVYITPEFSYYDEMKSAADKDQAKSYALGAQFRIDF